MKLGLIISSLLYLVMLMGNQGCNGCLEKERIGLLEIKHYILSQQDEEDSYSNHELGSWVDDRDSNCCVWNRVKCANISSGHITELSIQELLWSNDPKMLNVSLFCPFEELRLLDLSYNNFQGWIGNEGVPGLKKLETLDLSGNHLNSSSILSSLNGLTALTTLNLSYNNIDNDFFAQVRKVAHARKIHQPDRVHQTRLYKRRNMANLEEENASPSGQPIKESNLDEVLRLIKKSDYKIVDQLLQTPPKISILSLLLSSETHRKVLMKVLEQAYVDREVSVDQFNGIVGNITACNNLGFGDDELPEAGKHHNLALHISVHCKSDMISNVLVDTGSSLNVMPESTLRQLSHHGISLRGSSYLVKAFDGSRKDVLGEVDLPITIGPETFQITFQVMDINASYSCLLGRPWIHDAGAVTSTLHQKLKFMRNGKIVTVHGEEAYLVSQISSFSCVEAGSAEGTSFQGLTIEGAEPRRASASIASLKDAQKAVQAGQAAGWGKVIQILENKRKEGLGFSPTSAVSKGTFYSAGFINAITEDAAGGGHVPTFVIPGGTVRNWEAIDVPLVMHASM